MSPEDDALETVQQSDAQALLKKAERFRAFGQFHAAVDTLREAVKIDSDCAEAWYLLGKTLKELNRPDEARESLVRATEIDASKTEAWLELGLINYSQERYRDASFALKRYMDNGGKDIDALLTLARAAFRQSDCDMVLAVTGLILKMDEDVYEAWELRGLCQARKKRYNAAVMSLNMALELHRGSVYALNTVGDLCYEEENYERAIDFYRSSLASDWDQPRILFRMATSLWKVGRWQAAIPMLEEYVEIVPDDPRGWNNLGVVLRERGEVKRAIECYQRALQLDPDFEEARQNLETAKNKHIAL